LENGQTVQTTRLPRATNPAQSLVAAPTNRPPCLISQVRTTPGQIRTLNQFHHIPGLSFSDGLGIQKPRDRRFVDVIAAALWGFNANFSTADWALSIPPSPPLSRLRRPIWLPRRGATSASAISGRYQRLRSKREDVGTPGLVGTCWALLPPASCNWVVGSAVAGVSCRTGPR
jgi:hypothetical protein